MAITKNMYRQILGVLLVGVAMLVIGCSDGSSEPLKPVAPPDEKPGPDGKVAPRRPPGFPGAQQQTK